MHPNPCTRSIYRSKEIGFSVGILIFSWRTWTTHNLNLSSWTSEVSALDLGTWRRNHGKNRNIWAEDCQNTGRWPRLANKLLISIKISTEIVCFFKSLEFEGCGFGLIVCSLVTHSLMMGLALPTSNQPDIPDTKQLWGCAAMRIADEKIGEGHSRCCKGLEQQRSTLQC